MQEDAVIFLSHCNQLKRSVIIKHVLLYVHTKLAHQTYFDQVGTKFSIYTNLPFFQILKLFYFKELLWLFIWFQPGYFKHSNHNEEWPSRVNK